ncbi:MAG: hypothetical protein U5J83_12060 [Bryobacterales bacterium]|nr:hypothetical protein [Bryobacterales bacterium]
MASPEGQLPRQGDHVFNDLATVVTRPFDLVSSLGENVNPSRFTLRDFMPVALSEIGRMWSDPRYVQGRTLTSNPLSEPLVLRILEGAAPRHPAFQRISAKVMKQSHARNSTAFGIAGHKFALEVLATMLNALTLAVERPGSVIPTNLLRGSGARIPSWPLIATQSLVKTSFDPAAALVHVLHTAHLEGTGVMGSALPFAATIAETVEPWRPEQWVEVFQNRRIPSTSNAGRSVACMAAMWDFLQELQAYRINTILTRMVSEIASPVKGRVTDGEWQRAYAEAIAAIHMRMQQLAANAPS